MIVTAAAREQEIFDEVVGTDPDLRSEVLDRTCGDDVGLRRRIESLVTFHERAGLNEPPDATVAEFFEDKESDPFVGLKVGPFTLLRQIGAGGMGVVYEARQSSPDRKVAVKFLRVFQLSGAALRRFEREIEVLGSLQHPGIARIFEAGTGETPFGTLPWYAMELVDGRALDAHVAAARPSIESSVELLARIADAVDHAHGKDIVHRDLKPANILIESSGADALPKVLDFGVAKALAVNDATSSLRTEVGQLIGTLQYMSPEQAGGRTDLIDARSDVYALGVIAYEVLARRRPYELVGLPISSALAIVRDVDPPPLRRTTSGCPVDLDAVVFKALAKEPFRRYARAGELAADLRRVLRHEPVTARPQSTLYRVAKFCRRYRALVGGAVTTILVLVAGIVATNFQRIEATNARDDARELQRTAQRLAAESKFHAYAADVAAADAALAAGNTMIARQRLDATPPEIRHWEWNHVRSRLDGSIRRVTSSGFGGIAVDQGGMRVAATREHSLVIHDRSGDAWSVRSELRLDSFFCHDVRITPDGRWVAVAESAAGAVSTWDAGSGACRWRRPGLRTEIETIDISQDGGLVVSAGKDGRIVLWDGVTGEPKAESRCVPGGEWEIRFRNGDAEVVVQGPEGCVVFAVPDLRRVRSTARPSGFWNRGISPDGSTFGCTNDKSLVLVEVDTGRETLRIPAEHSIGWITWNHDGSLIAAPLGSGEITIREAGTGNVVTSLRGHTIPRDVCFFSGGEGLLSCGAEGVLEWDLRFTDSSLTFPGHYGDCWVYAVSGDGRTFVTKTGRDAATRVWDTESCSGRGAILPDMATGHAFALSGDGSLLAFSLQNAGVAVWDLDRFVELRVHDELRWGAAALRFSPDGRTLHAVSCEDGAILAFDTVTGASTVRRPGTGAIRERCASFSASLDAVAWERELPARGRRLEIVSLDGSGDTLTLQAPEGKRISGLQYLETPGLVVGNEGPDLESFDQVEVWDARSGQSLHRFQLKQASSCGVSPDGKRLVVGYLDGTIRLFDVANGAEVGRLSGQRTWAESVMFTPDGERLISTWPTGSIRIFDSRTVSERFGGWRELRKTRDEASLIIQRIEASGGTLEDLERKVVAEPAISREVRRAALDDIRSRFGSVSWFLERGWRLARTPDVSLGRLRTAEHNLYAAAHQGIRSARLNVIRGALLYRIGRLAESFECLELAHRMGSAGREDLEPAFFAYRSMVFSRLRRFDAAEESLADLGNLLQTARWVSDSAAADLLREAEDALEASRARVRAPPAVIVPPGFTVSAHDVGGEVTGIAAGRGSWTREVYFSTKDDGVGWLDTATGAIGRASGSIPAASGLAIDPGTLGTGLLYVAQDIGAISSVDPSGAVSTVSRGGLLDSSNGLAITPAGGPFPRALAVANGHLLGTISLVKANDVHEMIVPSSALPEAPTAVGFAPAGSGFGTDMLFTVQDRGLFMVTPSGAVTAHTGGLGDAAGLAISGNGPFGNAAYVVDTSNQAIYRVTPHGMKMVFATGLSVTNPAWGADLSFAPDGSRLYVASGRWILVIVGK